MAGGLISPPQKDNIIGNKDDSDDFRGAAWSPAMCYVYALLNPLNSYLRCGPIAKAPYLKVNTQPIKSSWTVTVGGWGVGVGGGFLLCDTQRNFWKSAKYIQSRSVLDRKAWSKQNCLNIL